MLASAAPDGTFPSGEDAAGGFPLGSLLSPVGDEFSASAADVISFCGGATAARCEGEGVFTGEVAGAFFLSAPAGFAETGSAAGGAGSGSGGWTTAGGGSVIIDASSAMTK
jgi:hypothetical protein